ncbi:MAG: HAD-IC family P-type ATPase, partial [Thermomicrobiales bacterium]|nr:HAD-IC family P-type ATPase [Thermomicrobiales bacterium]
MSDIAWYALDTNEAIAKLNSSVESGLTSAEAKQRIGTYGPNEIAAEAKASVWKVALKQLKDPMNIMLVIVSIASFVIGEYPVGILVGILVILNVFIGARQELAAQASVDALSRMQIPSSRVLRDGTLTQIPAPELVPGDIVQVEAGDLIPADGRLIRSATLETQEAALTGESVAIEKTPATIEAVDVQVGDRANMLFQNTSVTRGTATMVVTETGMNTQMGKIATMLSAVEPVPSPLQKELAQLTKLLGIIAWAAVAVIVILGLVRGNDFQTVLLLGISMAISAIPTGMPTFVQMILSHGARQLADANAIIKNLSDVETLGTTSAINSDKTGTLTMNAMTVRTLIHGSQRFTVQGEGYAKQGAILSAAGTPAPDLTKLALGLTLASDAVVGDDGSVLGDPTEAALVVLAAKVGVDAEETRRAYPRVAEVPFDSDYKFMATFHTVQVDGRPQLIELVKGAPDIVLSRCSYALGPDSQPYKIDADARARMLGVNQELSEKGLRVLAFGYRTLDGRDAEVKDDPMSFVEDLTLTGAVGILDPLRPEAITAVRVAHEAGIDVRMITGDHAVTAAAIGAELDLGPGAISGSEIQAMSDDELLKALPNLHVFGRVTPEDKLRIAKLMQQDGRPVAMTGDAVNIAEALRHAD